MTPAKMMTIGSDRFSSDTARENLLRHVNIKPFLVVFNTVKIDSYKNLSNHATISKIH